MYPKTRERAQVSGRTATSRIASAVALGLCLAVALPVQAVHAEGLGKEFADAFKEGEFDVNFRYRYEFVDADRNIVGTSQPVKDANASTLRSRLVFRTADLRGFLFTVNMDDLRPIISSDFNDTRNGKSEYAVVTDPKGTTLNLASVTYAGLEDAAFILGRQRIKRANDRFVGNVGWRQNEQTYDAFAAKYAVSEDFNLFYSYISRVKRIFGPDDGFPSADLSSSTNLFDLSYGFSSALNLFGYAYFMDLTERNDPAPPPISPDRLSNQTIGLRLTGEFDLSEKLQLGYTAEYAKQEDYKDNPNNYDEAYYRLDAGLQWPVWGIKASYEVLGGSGNAGEAFQTPLATLHAFQGWADLFLATPGGGIKDLFITASAKLLGGKWSLIYHDFSAETGGLDYGDELDFSAGWSFAEHYSVLAKFAVYNADQFAFDTNKFWLQLTADF